MSPGTLATTPRPSAESTATDRQNLVTSTGSFATARWRERSMIGRSQNRACQVSLSLIINNCCVFIIDLTFLPPHRHSCLFHLLFSLSPRSFPLSSNHKFPPLHPSTHHPIYPSLLSSYSSILPPLPSSILPSQIALLMSCTQRDI